MISLRERQAVSGFALPVSQLYGRGTGGPTVYESIKNLRDFGGAQVGPRRIVTSHVFEFKDEIMVSVQNRPDGVDGSRFRHRNVPYWVL